MPVENESLSLVCHPWTALNLVETGLNLVEGVGGGSPKSLNMSTRVCPQWTDKPDLESGKGQGSVGS